MEQKQAAVINEAAAKSNASGAARQVLSPESPRCDSPFELLERMHATAGNRAVGRWLQAKLKIGAPNDIYEQEADRVADQIMSNSGNRASVSQAIDLGSRADDHHLQIQRQLFTDVSNSAYEEDEGGQVPEPDDLGLQTKAAVEDSLQRKCSCEEEEKGNLQRKSSLSLSGVTAAPSGIVRRQCACGREMESSDDECAECKKEREGSLQRAATSPGKLENAPPIVDDVLRSSGQPLDRATRAFFEPRFGFNLGGVRVHADTQAALSADAVHARAYTVGQHVVFGQSQFSPESTSGKLLLAHELTHVAQQNGNPKCKLIQRRPDRKTTAAEYYEYQVLVPSGYTTLDEMYRLFERTVYGREMNLRWRCWDYCDMSKNQGKVIPFRIPRADVESRTDPALKKEQELSKKTYEQLAAKNRKDISDEVNRRYYQLSGDKPGTRIKKKGEEGKSRMWDQALNEVMKEKTALESLPPEIKALMGPERSYKPMDYAHLLRIAEKLKRFTPEDLAAYKLLTIRATDNLDVFEKSVDRFLARREELKNALQSQSQQQAAAQEDTLKEAIEKKWQGFDESALQTMSESDRYALARQKASELTEAQLQYMKSHPGETAKNFAQSALLMNTGETFSAIGKDIQEAATGDANSWARWAAGTGAGAKLSGWLLAVAGVLYVASWLTGIGELATIAAAAGYLLGATLTLSLAESELRIKAASQAKTPEEFKRNIELAAAARANVVVGVALIVIAFVVRGLAKVAFPETMKKLGTSLKNFRERVRLKGSIYDIKPQIKAEMGSLKSELAKQIDAAKAQAASQGAEVEKLSTEEFAKKLDKGEPGTIFDQSKLPPEQKLNYGELMKSPEGRDAVEGYRVRLANALKTDAPAEFDRVGQEYNTKIDEFLKAVEEAKNHDDLNAATDNIEGTLTEEHAKQFMQGEQERITQQKLDEAAAQAQQEAVKLARDSFVKRLRARIGGKPLPFTDAEIDSFLKEGKDLGLSDQSIEDTLYRAATSEKPLTAADVVDRLKSRAEGERKAAAARAAAEEARAKQQLKDDWDRFEPTHDQEFKDKLRDFRGNDDLTMNRKLSGGEGQLFLSDKTPGRALKRWFTSRLSDFQAAITRLGQAQAVVDSIPALKKLMSVVRIFEKGSDWIVRDFDSSSVPIAEAIKDPNVAAVRQQAIDALRGSSDPMAVEIRNKLEANSANIHWSPEQGKLLIIDTQ